MCKGVIFLASFVFVSVVLPGIVRSHVHDVNSARACETTHCERTEHCVNRKFWCKNPPCPRMIYCSKTRKESLKGPTTCESVRCSRGHVCHVKVRRCRWDQKCEHQIARCVSELNYSNEPASCTDFKCSSGYQCILKESLCSHPPCRLLKSCARGKDVEIWHSRCRTLGCPSEYECFLRRPEDDCSSTNSCKHTPDCTVTNGKQPPTDSYCTGWVCPRHQECSALTPEPCHLDDGCKVNRTCTKSLDILKRTSSPSSPRLFPRVPTSITPENSEASQPDDRESNPFTTQSTSSAIETVRQATSSRTDCGIANSTVHRGHDMQSGKWNHPSDSIYRTPVYFRSSVNRKSVESVESPRKLELPVDPSITQWLDDLRLKTGVDAINVWAKHAEENRKYEQFVEWLTAVETTLGPIRFEIWLNEIRKLTTTLPAFQKWLPASKSTERDIHNGNVTQQELPDQKQKPQSQTQRSYETTDGYVDSPGTLSPKGIENGPDRLTKSFRDAGQQTGKRWAWRYEKPGNVQSEQQPHDRQRIKELENWPDNSGQPQKTETTTIPSSIVPKQSYRTTVSPMPNKGVPIDGMDLAQFGRELDLYPLMRSVNDRSISNVHQKPSDQPTRKNAGHPRINYGRSPAAELRNGPQTWRRGNDSTDQKIKNVTSLESPVDSEVRLQGNTNSGQFQDPNASFDDGKNPEGSTKDQKPRLFPEEDRKKSSKGSETQKSDENEGVRDSEQKKKKDKTKIAFELAARMFDDSKIAYYTLLEFFPEEVNEELQLTGHPLTAGSYATISPYIDPWDSNLKHQLPSPVTQYFHQASFHAKGEKDSPGDRSKPLHSLVAPKEGTRQLPRVVLIDGTLEPIERFLESQNGHGYGRINWMLRGSGGSIPRREEKDFEQQSPFHVQNPYDDPYERGAGIPERPSLLMDGFGDYPGTLTPQEYVDVYVDALIDDALSEIILRKRLEEDLVNSNSRRFNAPTERQHTTTPSNPNDDQLACGNTDSSPTKEGYPVDKEQKEYFERFLRYQDEYFGDLEIDLTNYDFQYYYDDDKVILTENDGVEKL